MAQELQQQLEMMGDEEHRKFRDILRGLKRIKEEEGLDKLDDNILFDGAVRIYNSLLINKGMINARKIPGKGNQGQGGSAPMTDKQKNLLKDLDYKGSMNLTKAEATKIIEQGLARRRR